MSGRRVLAFVAAALLGILAIAAVVVVVRITRPYPPPRLSLAVPAQVVVAAGSPATIPVPKTGSLSLQSSVDGDVAQQSPAQVRPIGSVAKTLTALLVVEALPFPKGGDGQPYIITGNDVTLYNRAIALGGSAVAVTVGERFTERQLLLALMLPSANNLAETAALWVGHDRTAFIGQLNARALQLGMSNTHFDDPVGFSDATVSTTADLVKLGGAVLDNPTLADIVATREATLPDGTVVKNLDRDLGQPGWLGIKTGSTNAAGGCLLFAAERIPHGGGAPVRVIGAVLGLPTLDAALDGALAVANAALDSYTRSDLVSLSSGISGDVSSDWGSASTVSITPTTPGTIVVRSGTTMTMTFDDTALTSPLPPHSLVATVQGSVNGHQVVVYEVRTQAEVGSPGFRWRLTH